MSNESNSRNQNGISPQVRKLFSANCMVRLADELSNVKTTLPWLLSLAGAPAFFTGLLVPLRESLSMLPQMFLAPLIKRAPKRRGFWTAAAIGQAVCLGLMPTALLLDNGMVAGWLIIGLLVVFSLSRCFTSITSKDLVGKSVPKSIRGRMQGAINLVSGPFILLTGFIFLTLTRDDVSGVHLAALFAAAAALWLSGAWLIAGLEESDGETEDSDSTLKQALIDTRELLADREFRQLVLVRALLLSPILAAPFLTRQIVALRPEASILGLMIALSGTGTMLSAYFWGKLADHSSRATLFLAGLVSSTAVISLPLLNSLSLFPALDESAYAYLAVFVVLTAGHTGVRIGRKTFTVNMATGNQRTRIVATGNTLIGIILLLTSLTGLLAETLSLNTLLAFFSIPGLAGCLAALTLGK